MREGGKTEGGRGDDGRAELGANSALNLQNRKQIMETKFLPRRPVALQRSEGFLTGWSAFPPCDPKRRAQFSVFG